MPTPEELTKKFWKSLESDMTVMLGVDAEKGEMRPMTAQIEEDRSAIYFFTSKDAEVVKALGRGAKSSHLSFAAKGHDLFACVHGTMFVDNDPAAIDRHWNKFIAAWYPGGKSDPDIALLRFEPSHAEIWENASNLIAGIKAVLGINPQTDYRDKVAEVRL